MHSCVAEVSGCNATLAPSTHSKASKIILANFITYHIKLAECSACLNNRKLQSQSHSHSHAYSFVQLYPNTQLPFGVACSMTAALCNVSQHTACIWSCMFCQTLLQTEAAAALLQLWFAATQQEVAVSGARAIPVVREEDFASPALTHTVQQLLSQVQSRLVGVLREDDMPIPACCICHAAHQFWLQLCTHTLNKHAHMSLCMLSSHAPVFSSAGLLCIAKWVRHFLLGCCKPELQQRLAKHAIPTGGCVWGYNCTELQSCNTLCNTSLQGSVAERYFALSVFGIHTLTIAIALTVHAARIASRREILAHAHHMLCSAPCMTHMHGPSRLCLA